MKFTLAGAGMGFWTGLHTHAPWRDPAPGLGLRPPAAEPVLGLSQPCGPGLSTSEHSPPSKRASFLTLLQSNGFHLLQNLQGVFSGFGIEISGCRRKIAVDSFQGLPASSKKVPSLCPAWPPEPVPGTAAPPRNPRLPFKPDLNSISAESLRGADVGPLPGLATPQHQGPKGHQEPQEGQARKPHLIVHEARAPEPASAMEQSHQRAPVVTCHELTTVQASARGSGVRNQPGPCGPLSRCGQGRPPQAPGDVTPGLSWLLETTVGGRTLPHPVPTAAPSACPAPLRSCQATRVQDHLCVKVLNHSHHCHSRSQSHRFGGGCSSAFCVVSPRLYAHTCHPN